MDLKIWRFLAQILQPITIWICSRESRVQILDRVVKIANWSASQQLGFVTVYVLFEIFVYLFIVSPISTTVLNTYDTYINKVTFSYCFLNFLVKFPFLVKYPLFPGNKIYYKQIYLHVKNISWWNPILISPTYHEQFCLSWQKAFQEYYLILK